MNIMNTDTETMSKLSFYEDADGVITAVYDGAFFSGVIINQLGELTYQDGELIDILKYEERTLH